MVHLGKRLISVWLCILLLSCMPLTALATDTSTSQTGSSTSDEDIEQSIANNPDLSDEEKALWMEWSSEETAEDTTAADEEEQALQDALEDAIDVSQDGTVDLTDLEVNDALPDNVVNILLLGVDNRSTELATGLSDAVIICSINMDDGSVKLTSITRDTEVSIPGYKSTKRINCAYKFGSKDGDLANGAFLAMKTINRNFQMNIQRYVLVNIHGLASIIDELGGIDLDMTKKEASRINYELRKEPMDSVKRTKVEAIDGIQHLDGMQAVTYARIRGIDNDFMRTERQRKLLQTLLASVMNDISITKLVGLVETAMPYGMTNLTAADMLGIGKTVISGDVLTSLQTGADVLTQFRVPMDGTYKYKTVSGATLTAFRSTERKKENIVAMQEFIYGESYYQD